ncbi:MAG: penicillin-binding protein 2 [Armatimonadetes bacterium]|nr:penicillin-binding protein 2 [Armatimonadota bacterium]
MPKRKRANPDSKARIYVCAAVVTLAFGGAMFSQARAQLILRDDVLSRDSPWSGKRSSAPTTPQIGAIISSDGQILAETENVYEFSLFYDRLPHSPTFFMELSEATGFSASDLQSGAWSSRKSWRADRLLNNGQKSMVRRIATKWRADGVSLLAIGSRYYPLLEAASGVIGRVGADGPVNGIELEQAAALRTNDITLTINSELQVAAHTAVRHAVEINKADSGTAIVIDPTTGDVLAMVNWPSFNPESVTDPSLDYNTAYMAQFEPGSTFKILTLAKAIDSGAIRRDNSLVCDGRITVGGQALRCDEHGGSRAHGTVDNEKAIARSCNISAAQWSMAVGVDGMRDFIATLGILAPPGIGLPSEKGSRFKQNPGNATRQIAELGFGQSIGVPAILMANAFAALANDGLRMKLRLIKSVGKRETPVESAERIVSAEAAAYVRKLMESVIHEEYGTADQLMIPGYRIAGKTGTSQKIGTAVGGNISNFVGFVPAGKPRAVIYVVIDNPRAGQIYGGIVAGPAFREIALAVIDQLEIPRSPQPAETSDSQE